jgi:hypothetical protein
MMKALEGLVHQLDPFLDPVQGRLGFVAVRHVVLSLQVGVSTSDTDKR